MLTEATIRDVQKLLSSYRLYLGPLDGLWGPKTERALNELINHEPSRWNAVIAGGLGVVKRRLVSARGVEFIQRREGLKLNAYQDSVGIWTIGYGHVSKKVFPNSVITKGQASLILVIDLIRFERAICQHCDRYMVQPQFDAVVSWALNNGQNALPGTDLQTALNEGNAHNVGTQLMRWTKAWDEKQGALIEVEGLRTRRQAESDLFIYGKYE